MDIKEILDRTCGPIPDLYNGPSAWTSEFPNVCIERVFSAIDYSLTVACQSSTADTTTCVNNLVTKIQTTLETTCGAIYDFYEGTNEYSEISACAERAISLIEFAQESCGSLDEQRCVQDILTAIDSFIESTCGLVPGGSIAANTQTSGEDSGWLISVVDEEQTCLDRGAAMIEEATGAACEKTAALCIQTLLDLADPDPLITACGSTIDPDGEDGPIEVWTGDAGDNQIWGTSGPDIIFGLGGNDVLKGLAGDDVLCGGFGHDGLNGGGDLSATSDNDQLYGEGGRDFLIGAMGNDIVYGGRDNDGIYGGPGDDTLSGDDPPSEQAPAGSDDAVSDYVLGGGGTDTFVQSPEDDATTFTLTEPEKNCLARSDPTDPEFALAKLGTFKPNRLVVRHSGHPCKYGYRGIVTSVDHGKDGDGKFISEERSIPKHGEILASGGAVLVIRVTDLVGGIAADPSDVDAADPTEIKIEFMPRDFDHFSRLPQVGNMITVWGLSVNDTRNHKKAGEVEHEIHPAYHILFDGGAESYSGRQFGGSPFTLHPLGKRQNTQLNTQPFKAKKDNHDWRYCWLPDGTACKDWNGDPTFG